MRQLAAILFADITGHTALMQENEQLAILKRRRLKEVLDATITKFNGKTLQYYGDGSLNIFNSSNDGVACAISIHDKKIEMNPQMRAAIENKGWSVGMKGDWEKAAEYFTEVHRLYQSPAKRGWRL